MHNIEKFIVSLHQKKEINNNKFNLKNKEYETSYIILIDGFDDCSSFRS